jgi:hypothetical protein
MRGDRALQFCRHDRYEYCGRIDKVTSEKQAKANRENALKSTGPKTPEGKAAVRLNAVKHGLLSRETLLPGEDEEALRELDEHVRDELQPVGELENLLADRIISAYWRLSRLGRVEAGMFAWGLYGEWAMRAHQEASSYTKQVGGLRDLDPDPFQPTTKITDQEKYQEAVSKAREMDAKQKAETATLGRTFIRDADGANAFSKLSRYETTIERSLYKALHELQRVQAARRGGGSAPPPAAIDVDVSGVSGDEP